MQVISLIRPGFFLDKLEAAGVEVHSLGMRPGLPDIRAIFSLVRLLRRYRPDIVHAHMLHANLLASVSSLLLPGTPLVCTSHNIDEFKGSRTRLWFARLLRGLPDFFSSISRRAHARYLELGAMRRDRSAYVPNGIDTGVFRHSEAQRAELRSGLAAGQDEFVWLAVGRFDPQKDYSNLLQAAESLRHLTRSPFRILIAGSGVLAAAIESEVQARGLDPIVTLLGVRNDVPALMSAADGFVMSSAWEGMPLVLLEALACGCPVVATGVGGVPELLADRPLCEVVPPRQPADLAAGMFKVMQGRLLPEAAAGKDENRRFIVRNFDIDAVTGRWLDIYGGLIAGQRVPGVSES